MKILDSKMFFSSDNYFEQMDLSLNEKTKEKTFVQKPRALKGTRNLSQVFMDRVSISQKENFDYKSSYSADMKSKSSVKSIQSGDVIEYEQQFAIKKLVGGIIDKDVVISSIQKKEDISLSDNAKNTAQTGPGSASMISEISLRQTDIHFEEEKVNLESFGQVTTRDGRMIDFSLDMSLDREFLSRSENETLVRKWQERVNLTDPLVINLDGKAPHLSDVSFSFDLNSDGKAENISFTSSGSGFLAFDKNNDNVINDGSELFGPGTGNGFQELAAFDEDQNNWIDENDAVFSKLSVWTKDKEGKDKLISLKDAGIGAIALDYAATRFNVTKLDNSLKGQLKSTGMFLFENGNVGSVHQIDLAVHTPEKIKKGKAGFLQEDTRAAPVESTVPSAGGLSLPMVTEDHQPEAVPNPLQELIDQIEKLKEEMGQLLEKMNPALNHNRFGRLKRHHYISLNPDTSVLLFGNKGPVRQRSRYA
ncbi:MAG: hypothetical protein GXP56_11565 [Deltaproteobacteria bacterium]|nr:hypothetical protein [Deltaproteobacteria bacterium]